MVMPNAAPKQIIAIDFGLKRIGIAIGNSLTNNAQPLTTIITDKPYEIPNELIDIIKEWRPHKLIMGMPYNADGSEAKIAKNIKRFASLLSEKLSMPVEFIDESFSSHEATRQLKHLRQSGARSKRVNKADIDKAAAAVMLQRWMDESTFKENNS